MSSIGNNDDDVNRMHISDSSGDDSVESAEILEVPGSQAQKGSNVSKEKSKRKKPPVAPSPSTSTTADESLASCGRVGNNPMNVIPEDMGLDDDDDEIVDAGAYMNNLFRMESGSGGIEEKSELDKYLTDAVEFVNDPTFDILQYWKDRKKRYPILRMMARDVLAIPVSTVASESAFSTGGRVLDSFRTSLTPRMVEALVCGQDWLRSQSKPIFIEENLLELESLEAGMKELILEQPTIIIDETISDEEED